MGFFVRALASRALAVGSGVMMAWAAGACSGGSQKQADSAANQQDGPPPPCAKDEVREYLCDDLLPTHAEQAAAEPYETCPRNVGVKGSVFPATSNSARFDVPRTEWTRKRVPPGHACCYSWCSKLELADVEEIDAGACQQPNAMREKLCVSTAEAGVSEAAPSPNEQCAPALTPPPGVSFAAPKAAGLDAASTAERRGQGLSECCYAWCSKAPLGTGLGAK